MMLILSFVNSACYPLSVFCNCVNHSSVLCGRKGAVSYGEEREQRHMWTKGSSVIWGRKGAVSYVEEREQRHMGKKGSSVIWEEKEQRHMGKKGSRGGLRQQLTEGIGEERERWKGCMEIQEAAECR